VLRTTLIRLGFAALLTLAGLLATFKISEGLDPGEMTLEERKPIAHAIGIDGVHFVKHEDSKFSTPLQEGESIYAGDTVKTSERGGLKVKFPTEDVLELESDTTVIFTLSGDHVVLGLMDGYVNANLAGGGASTLQVKTDDGKSVALTQKAQLSRDGASGVQVTSATSVPTKQSLNIKWVSPVSEIEHALNPDDPVPVTFNWSGGLPTQKVVVQWGPSRKKMTQSVSANGDLKELKGLLPIGRHFWRWAVYEEGKEEPVFTSPSAPARIRGVFAPAVVGPTSGSTLLVKNLNEQINLKWTENERYDEYKVEVAKDASFKEILVSESLKATGTYAFQAPRLGAFYWRLSGHDVKPEIGWLKGKTHEFNIKTKESEKAKVKWITKIDAPIRYATQNPSVTLNWSAEPAKIVKQYQVRVASADDDLKNAPKLLSDKTEFLVNLDKQGRYNAIVEALNAESEVIGQTAILSFEARPIPILRAPAMITPIEEPIRADARGRAEVAWQQLEGAKEYKVEVKNSEGAPQLVNAKGTTANLNRLMPGEYEVRLSAIDTFGRQGQVSEPYKLIVPNKNAIKLKVKKVEVR
jgi:hypothetical protein